MKTDEIVPTVIEEAQHILQRSKGRTIPLKNGFTQSDYLTNRGEVAVEKSGANLVSFLGNDRSQLTDIYNRAHSKTADRYATYRDRVGPGELLVKNKETGQIGTIKKDTYNATKYERV